MLAGVVIQRIVAIVPAIITEPPIDVLRIVDLMSTAGYMPLFWHVIHHATAFLVFVLRHSYMLPSGFLCVKSHIKLWLLRLPLEIAGQVRQWCADAARQTMWQGRYVSLEGESEYG